MATIASAYVQLLPTTDGIGSNLMSALQGPSESAGTSAGETLGTNIISGLAGTTALIASAAVEAVQAVISAVDEVAKAGDTIDKQSQKLGISAQEYQTLQFAAEHCGFEMSTFQTAARMLGDTDFDGNIYDAINSIMELDSQEERTAKAQELFGDRCAQAMAPLINGTMSADDYKASLEALGGMMSDEAVADAAAYADAMTDMNTSIDGLKTQLMDDFMPAMSDVMNGIAALVSGDGEGVSQISEGIQEFIQNLTDLVPELLQIGMDMVVSLVDGLTESLPDILDMGLKLIEELCNGLVENLPELTLKAVDIIVSLTTGLIEHIPDLIVTAVELIAGLTSGLIGAIPDIVAKIPEIIEGILGAFKEGVPKMLECGKNLLFGLKDGIVGSVTSVVESVVEAASEILDSILSFFGIHSPSTVFRDMVGGNLMAGFAEGITDGSGDVKDAIDDVAEMTLNEFDDITPELNISAGAGTASDRDDSGVIAAVMAIGEQIVSAIENDSKEVVLNGRKVGEYVAEYTRRNARASAW